jgi:hypothetical protein
LHNREYRSQKKKIDHTNGHGTVLITGTLTSNQHFHVGLDMFSLKQSTQIFSNAKKKTLQAKRKDNN